MAYDNLKCSQKMIFEYLSDKQISAKTAHTVIAMQAEARPHSLRSRKSGNRGFE